MEGHGCIGRMDLVDLNVVFPKPALRERRVESESQRRVQFETCAVERTEQTTPFGSLGNKNSPNRRPSPGKRSSNRGCMNSRYRKGKPGSRRHQRWLNGMYLEDDFSDAEEYLVTDFQRMYDSFQDLWERPNFSFVEAYEDPDNKPVLDKFFHGRHDDIMEGGSSSGEEDEFAWVGATSRNADDSTVGNNTQARIARIPMKSRRMIEKYAETEFVRDLENAIRAYVRSGLCVSMSDDDEWEVVGKAEGNAAFVYVATTFECSIVDGALVVTLQDSLARLMTHGVCAYYNLRSESETIAGQRRTRIFSARGVGRKVPKARLQDVLQVEKARRGVGKGGSLPKDFKLGRAVLDPAIGPHDLEQTGDEEKSDGAVEFGWCEL
mmetsp:Transcript_7109/g.20149  ORF Transcript_7109/g.20149 Transcript_7109/m.20149 type:complete len:379 (+) Transcript_7109:70-1206(+)